MALLRAACAAEACFFKPAGMSLFLRLSRGEVQPTPLDELKIEPIWDLNDICETSLCHVLLAQGKSLAPPHCPGQETIRVRAPGITPESASHNGHGYPGLYRHQLERHTSEVAQRLCVSLLSLGTASVGFTQVVACIRSSFFTAA